MEEQYTNRGEQSEHLPGTEEPLFFGPRRHHGVTT
jgi:hypothetical protein